MCTPQTLIHMHALERTNSAIHHKKVIYTPPLNMRSAAKSCVAKGGQNVEK